MNDMKNRVLNGLIILVFLNEKQLAKQKHSCDEAKYFFVHEKLGHVWTL